jgi:hypothetical protein
MDYPGKVITKNQVTPTQTSATGVWTLDDAAAATRNNNWPVAGVPNPISKSLRFNSADSAYLNRTLSTSGSLTTWTWSAWVKLSGLGSLQVLFSAGTNGVTYHDIYINSDDTLRFVANVSGTPLKYTTQVFRDTSAWYHIVGVWDTPNATADDRMRLYVNGVRITAFSTSTNPTSSQNGLINNSSYPHAIGRRVYSSSNYFSGYMAEVNFIDGQALTPSSFGMTDPVTGVWEPLKYSGTYGTNGFYLNFKDATSTTTLGLDYSGNSNTWTTNNFSVTAGSGNDSLTDVPTPWIVYNTTGDVGGLVRGNYCTFNPLFKLGGTAAGTWCLNGALQAKSDSNASMVIFGTMGLGPSTKFYNEFTMTNIVETNDHVGIVTDIQAAADSGTCIAYKANGDKIVNGTTSAYGATYTDGDIIGIAVNLVDNQVTFYKNGASQGTITGVTAGTYFHRVRFNNISGQQSECFGNWGQRAFAYTPPSGFLSLCTTNLPASTVLKGSEYMNAVLYTGTGSPLSVTGVGFKPDWVWAKKRSATDDHVTSDALRGVQKDLTPNSTAAEATNTNGLQSFDSDGFSIGSGSGSGVWGGNSGATYVAWNWKASNAAGVTNTAGSITSTVSANTTSGFSIVTYTGTVANATVGHGLGVAPHMIITKRRTTFTSGWGVWHTAIAGTEYLLLNSTAAKATATTAWNSTIPTSTVFSIGDASFSNGSVDGYVAYCFAPISGFSAFGSYTGNGSADGPFVYLGFRPRYILIKRTDVGDAWAIKDTVRDPYNVDDSVLKAETSDAESTSTFWHIDELSNGFKLRNLGSTFNNSGGTYIYAAFAENPFKNALAR